MHPTNVIVPPECSSTGTKLIDKIMSQMHDHLMEQLQRHLVGEASNIVNATKFCTSLVHQHILEKNQMATGPEVQERQNVERAIKVACSKKAIGSLVFALQSSNNECILLETLDWLDSSQAKEPTRPISVGTLARQLRPAATGIFVATGRGLIALNLQTQQVKALTREFTRAVAVYHTYQKVYWVEGTNKSSIWRSNYDGSAKERITEQKGDWICMLATQEETGNVYFSETNSNKIQVCYPPGNICVTVISRPTLVKFPLGVALDSEKGYMYWGQRGSGPHSIVRAILDGSNPTIISTGFSNLHSIALDQPSNGVLYWTDIQENTIGAVDVNGSNKQTLVQLESDKGPYTIQVDANTIYIGSFKGKKIQTVDRYSGNNLTTVYESVGEICNLALFNAI